MTTTEVLWGILGRVKRGRWPLPPVDMLEGPDIRAEVIAAAQGDDDLAVASLRALYDAGMTGLSRTNSGPRAGVEGWCDHPQRTWEELEETFARAIGVTR